MLGYEEDQTRDILIAAGATFLCMTYVILLVGWILSRHTPPRDGTLRFCNAEQCEDIPVTVEGR